LQCRILVEGADAGVPALRAACIILPPASVIERTAIAGRARARSRATNALLTGISDAQMSKLDGLLAPDPSTNTTPFAWLKAVPIAPKADHVGELLDRLKMVRGIGLPHEVASRIHEERLRQFVREGHASDAHQLGRYAAHRRRAILVATVLDLEMALTDAVLDMADKLVGGFFAKARNATRQRYAASAGTVGRLVRLFHGTIDALAVAQEAKRDAFEAVDAAVGWPKLLRVRGEVKELANLGDKLRSGDVWVERSSNYRRFDSYLLPAAAAPAAATELKLPATADEWLAARGQELDRRLRRFMRQVQKRELEGVEFQDGRLHITPVKATTTPEARAFADGIETIMPRVRITELLHEVNRATGFASAFTNLRTGEQCEDDNALLAAILADATDLGLGRMAAASHGVTRDKLVWTADAYIRPETYKAALAKIIDTHHALPVARIWGDGTTSSSDRQFFRSGKRGDTAGDVNALKSGSRQRSPEVKYLIPRRNLASETTTEQFFIANDSNKLAFNCRFSDARYGVDPGLGFYTHVSDQHGPYNVRVMSATSHEAPYVLDGLMHHGTGLKIGTHYTDTGGASDHVFILCAMLGFRFCPRLRDFPDRKLARIETATAYKDLQPILGRRIRTDVIHEHWDDVLRLVASLQAGTVLPSAMLKRLAAFQRQNQLDLALQELGRIERTLFMLDWLESPQLRQLCQAGLNKSEQRHALAQVICTFKQGRIADRGQDAQQFRASGLNLAIAAIVYWNSTYLADAIVHLGKDGKLLPPELLAHTSPLMWEHVGFSGDFLRDRAAATAGHRRPLNLGRERLAA
jgi:TnpA family transposase